MIKTNHPPYFSLLIASITLVYSLYVAYDINGSLFEKVRILQLESYGGVTLDHLKNFEIWRLFTSQIIHVKQPHMLFNVLSLVVLGIFLERYIGFFKMLVLWFFSGSAGTVFSTLFVSPPWNLGTGASQAIMGISALGVILIYQRIDVSKGLKSSLVFAIAPALLLDLIFAHYPKPGHLMGFIVGCFISLYYLRELETDRQNAKGS